MIQMKKAATPTAPAVPQLAPELSAFLSGLQQKGLSSPAIAPQRPIAAWQNRALDQVLKAALIRHLTCAALAYIRTVARTGETERAQRSLDGFLGGLFLSGELLVAADPKISEPDYRQVSKEALITNSSVIRGAPLKPEEAEQKVEAFLAALESLTNQNHACVPFSAQLACIEKLLPARSNPSEMVKKGADTMMERLAGLTTMITCIGFRPADALFIARALFFRRLIGNPAKFRDPSKSLPSETNLLLPQIPSSLAGETRTNWTTLMTKLDPGDPSSFPHQLIITCPPWGTPADSVPPMQPRALVSVAQALHGTHQRQLTTWWPSLSAFYLQHLQKQWANTAALPPLPQSE